MPTKITDEKKPPAGVAERSDVNGDVRRTAYEARIAKERAKCEPLSEQIKFFMASIPCDARPRQESTRTAESKIHQELQTAEVRRPAKLPIWSKLRHAVGAIQALLRKKQ